MRLVFLPLSLRWNATLGRDEAYYVTPPPGRGLSPATVTRLGAPGTISAALQQKAPSMGNGMSRYRNEVNSAMREGLNLAILEELQAWLPSLPESARSGTLTYVSDVDEILDTRGGAARLQRALGPRPRHGKCSVLCMRYHFFAPACAYNLHWARPLLFSAVFLMRHLSQHPSTYLRGHVIADVFVDPRTGTRRYSRLGSLCVHRSREGCKHERLADNITRIEFDGWHLSCELHAFCARIHSPGANGCFACGERQIS